MIVIEKFSQKWEIETWNRLVGSNLEGKKNSFSRAINASDWVRIVIGILNYYNTGGKLIKNTAWQGFQ